LKRICLFPHCPMVISNPFSTSPSLLKFKVCKLLYLFFFWLKNLNLIKQIKKK
jgi:hypothetical protein